MSQRPRSLETQLGTRFPWAPFPRGSLPPAPPRTLRRQEAADLKAVESCRPAGPRPLLWSTSLFPTGFQRKATSNECSGSLISWHVRLAPGSPFVQNTPSPHPHSPGLRLLWSEWVQLFPIAADGRAGDRTRKWDLVHQCSAIRTDRNYRDVGKYKTSIKSSSLSRQRRHRFYASVQKSKLFLYWNAMLLCLAVA